MGERLSANMLLAYSPEQDNPIQVVSHGTATSNGAADGTTLVDASGDSGGADTYNGRYWVELLSGTYKGLCKRVVDDDGAGTLTFEGTGFPGQIVSGVEYRIIATSEALIVVDSSGGATDVVDAVRDEANSYWIGYGVEPITGSRLGEAKAVSAFTGGTGTFVVGAFSGALAAGDVCLLRRPIEPAGMPSFTPGHAYHKRPMRRVNFSKGPGSLGVRSATIAFDLHVKGSGALAADAAITTASEIHGLMQACGYSEEIGTSALAGAGSNTTAIKIATGTHERFAIGQAIQHRGNTSFINSKTDGGGAVDTLTVSPPLPVAPTAADTINACRTYYPDTTRARKPVTIYFERDAVRYTLFGCIGNVEIVPGDDTEILAKFSFTADHYITENEECDAINTIQALYSTAQPLIGADRIAYLDTTRVDIGGVSVGLGHSAVNKKVSGAYGVNGTAGQQPVNQDPMIKFRQLMDEDSDALTAESLYQAQTAKVVAIIYGSHGNCMAIRAPVARVVEYPAPGDSEGMMVHNYAFEPQDAGTASDPTDGTVKVPDFAIHIF